jgi:glycolate oxidase iron-sulfur subunit
MKDLEELTTHCIRCGFCLEACPTFTETASELESPRGRIYLVRSALEGQLNWAETQPHLDQCLGCRACETACPSGVEYGQILELARSRLPKSKPRAALLGGLTNPAILRLQLEAARLVGLKRLPKPLASLIAAEAPEANLPTPQLAPNLPPLDPLPDLKGEVYFLEGCAMRVLYPRVHACAKRLLRRVGYQIREVRQGCCGALHAHAGDLKTAHQFADALAEAMDEALPIIVDSAGCGSAMKEYENRGFASRVQDLTEFLASHGLAELLAQSKGIKAKATYHDACHLAHGQRITKQPRDLLAAIPNLDLVPMNEADTCCGSAGIYNLTQPAMARRLLERKWANVEATGAEIVATGNPGCHAWIAQASREHHAEVAVLHTAELLEASFIGLETLDET